MDLFGAIINRQASISVVGLGYVGLPLAVAFAEKANVIGFDISQAKVDLYRRGQDATGEVGAEAVTKTTALFTSEEASLQDALFHIVAVPTPINPDKTPDLSPVVGASEIVGRNLVKGSVVVYESTVYPGVTEDICVPILEGQSGLRCGVDFKVGYSPERINPGDKVHRLNTIVKVVAGMDAETLDTVAKIYELVVDAGVYRAESIKVAEAAKVIENTQRDINIAFMNELSIIFNKMGLDTHAVLAAARTKWNFLNFSPGLVGGHCIGVDPYYLTYKAQQLGYHPQVILAGRRINDDMGRYVAENAVKLMIRAGKQIAGARVALLGVTFKENCPDIRNSRVIDIVTELRAYGASVVVSDPLADPQEVSAHYGLDLVGLEEVTQVDAVIIAVAHHHYANISAAQLKSMYSQGPYPLIDVKRVRPSFSGNGFLYWGL